MGFDKLQPNSNCGVSDYLLNRISINITAIYFNTYFGKYAAFYDSKILIREFDNLYYFLSRNP